MAEWTWSEGFFEHCELRGLYEGSHGSTYQERWSDDTAKPAPVLPGGEQISLINVMAFDSFERTSKMELCARSWISLR